MVESRTLTESRYWRIRDASQVTVFTSFMAAAEKFHLFLLKTQLPMGEIQESYDKNTLYTSSFLSFKYFMNLAPSLGVTRHHFMPLSDTSSHRLIIVMT